MDASYAQTSFLGGEISQWAQGQYDRPEYKISLAKASNILIVDEGAAPRRPGFQFLGTTRDGAPGRVMPFDFSESTPYNMEFTDGSLRFWNGTNLVTSNDSQMVASVSSASPAVFTLPLAVTWQTGDQVYFTFANPAVAVAGAVLLNRQFTLTMLTPTTFTIVDSITGAAINASMFSQSSIQTYSGAISSGSISNLPFSGAINGTQTLVNLSATVNHIAQIQTPYTAAGADWHSLRAVQGLTLSMLLQTSVAPQALQVLSAPMSSQFATFSYSTAAFQDGPYLDPPANAVATPSGLSGNIQITVGYPAWVSSTVYGFGVPVTYNGQDYLSLQNNNTGNTPGATGSTFWQALPLGSMISAQGFVQTDVGRMMRLFSAPQDWNPSTTYLAGAVVAYPPGTVSSGGASYFSSLTNSNTNNEPDISLTEWVLNPSGAVWTWGTITAVLSANTVTVQIQGTNLLYTTAIPSFRIGAWSNTTGWPTCGCYQGGRFWFGGAIPNRFDTSQPDTPFIMSPTQPDGTVTDANGISYTLNSNSVDQLEWMEPMPQGVLIGTRKGEYLLSSGTSGGPITPSSIAESPATKYGSESILPVKTGLTLCFVQRYGRRLLEYLADVFSLRSYGPDLTTYARHLGARQFQELAYQQEPAPVVWARMGDGSLVGTTYRRVSLFSNQKPEFNAWHQHPIGSGRVVESICVGPSSGGILDTLAAVTNDPSSNIRFVESLTPLMDETDPLTSAWFLDAAVTPQAASMTSNAVTFYGLNYLDGRIVSVFAAGVDCGDWLVENGQVTIPLGTSDPISGYTFDIPQFKILQPLISTFENSVTIVSSGVDYVIPCVIGFNYQSQGQLCRPMLPVDTGAKNGPGFAKKKRTARYGINLVGSLGVQVGTDFANTLPVPVLSPGGNLPPYLSTFSGIKRETLKNDFSFDSMLCWQTTRPFPATVTTFGGFINTEDV
jgi:hypothetical protein